MLSCILFLLQIPAKQDNLPLEGETEEKETGATKEDDVPSEKPSNEVCGISFSFFSKKLRLNLNVFCSIKVYILESATDV